MANARLEELKARFDENPRRYFAPYANELRKTGDLAQAVSICRSHLAVQPGHVSGHIVLAQALSESGSLDESRAEFEAALELDPENLIALRAMGDIARARGDAPVAREWYQRVLDADPRNEEIARTLREMAAVPNEYSAPAAAPAPLSMLVPDMPLAGHSETKNEATAVPSAGDHAPSTPESAASVAPHAPARGEEAAALPQPFHAPERPESVRELPAPPAPALQVPQLDITAYDEPATESLDSMDDFIPFESIDSIDSAGDADGGPLPPRVAAESVDLSDFTMMEPEATGTETSMTSPAGPTASSQPTSAEFAATWSDTDEFSVDEAQPREAASEGEQAADATAADTGWMSPLTPAGDLSDYEAAPETFLDETPAPTARPEPAATDPGPNGVTPPSSARYEDDIETWFNTNESVAPPSRAELSPASGGDAAGTAPAAEWKDYTDAETGEVALPEAQGEPITEAGAEGGDAPGDPEPIQAAARTDPLVGRTPTLVEAVPETPVAPFVTETLAELYLQQGFRDEALAIYRQLIERNPSDLSLRRRVEAIERGAVSDVVPDIAARSSTTGHRGSMSVRTFFGRLARRTPSRPASSGNAGRGSRTTGSWESVGVRRTEASPDDSREGGYRAESSHESEPVEQPSALATLFATARPSESDTRAATALASAFTESQSTLSPSGRPSRTAERELSLDHLFRDDADGVSGEGAPALGSMDDFYGAQSPVVSPPEAAPGGATGASASGGPPPASGHAPDERNTDLRQFTAWLEGLKKK